MTDNQIKIALYRNYSRFSKMITRNDYVNAVKAYIQFVIDSIAIDDSISRDYATTEDLCTDFYYCTF